MPEIIMPLNDVSNYAWRFTNGRIVNGLAIYNVEIVKIK